MFEEDNKGNCKDFDDFIKEDKQVINNVKSVMEHAEKLLAAFNKLQNHHLEVLVAYKLVHKLYKLFNEVLCFI